MTSQQIQFLAGIKVPQLRRYIKRPWELRRKAARFFEAAKERERNESPGEPKIENGQEEALNIEIVDDIWSCLTYEECEALDNILAEIFR